MAIYYFRNAGVNWGDAANWSLTDGGGATGAVPTAADDAYFTSNSGNCTVNASARVCKTLIFAGVGAGNYANTITMTNGITVSGNVTLSATMTIDGAGNLTINATSTYDSNTKTFPNTLILTGAITVTLAEDATIQNFNPSGASNITINSNNLYVLGDITINRNISGTTTLHALTTASTTGTWSSNGTNIANNFKLNPAGTLVISGTVLYSTGTLEYVGGTVTTTGSTISFIANTTVKSNGLVWNNWTHTNGQWTIILSDNATINDLTILSAGLVFNSNNLFINGNLNQSGNLFGTTTLNLTATGAGTWNGGGISSSYIKLNPSGSLTITGNITKAGGTIEYVGGTVNMTGITLILNVSPTIKSNGYIWENWQLTNGGTVVLSDNATIKNLLVTFTSSIINGNNLFINGDISSSFGLSGTTTLNITGTANQSFTFSSTLSNNLVINKSSGNLNLSGTTVIYGGASSTLTHTAGTIAPGTTTFQTNAGTTYNINSSGFTLWNWSPLTGTHTINTGTITVNNNLRFNGNTTFAGTGGWTANDLTDSTAGRTLSLKDGSTYTVTGNLALTGTNASPFVVASSSATLRAILTLNQGANQTVQFVRATRIDSGAGQTIWDTVGTIVNPLTDTINWNSGAKPAPNNKISMA